MRVSPIVFSVAVVMPTPRSASPRTRGDCAPAPRRAAWRRIAGALHRFVDDLIHIAGRQVLERRCHRVAEHLLDYFPGVEVVLEALLLSVEAVVVLVARRCGLAAAGAWSSVDGGGRACHTDTASRAGRPSALRRSSIGWINGFSPV